MKIGHPAELARSMPNVHLPAEIIACIISFLSSTTAGRKSLWSCCLVSRLWYSAAVPSLYENIRLTGLKFEQFAATLCPPVNAHVRCVGLEQYVRRLDLGGLAYESTRSLTARLLRRVGRNLEVLVAPATSFSISSLAPLAKCENLRFLDLSFTLGAVGLSTLLRSICKLQQLTVLYLPPNTIFYEPEIAWAEHGRWPPNLAELQFSGGGRLLSRQWENISYGWPKSLKSLTITNFPPPYMIDLLLPQITSLRITGRVRVLATMDFMEFLMIFPCLRFIEIPLDMLEGRALLELPADCGIFLERIKIGPRSSGEKQSFKHPDLLNFLTQSFKNLWQLQLAEECMELDQNLVNWDDIEALLVHRAVEQSKAGGLVVVDRKDAGILVF